MMIPDNESARWHAKCEQQLLAADGTQLQGKQNIPRKQSMHPMVQTVVPDSRQLFSIEKIDRLTKADVAKASLWFSGNLWLSRSLGAPNPGS
jgi:hypothetical protein